MDVLAQYRTVVADVFATFILFASSVNVKRHDQKVLFGVTGMAELLFFDRRHRLSPDNLFAQYCVFAILTFLIDCPPHPVNLSLGNK